jgi:uncharacterized Ntn-hydrolase superfamily protein
MRIMLSIAAIRVTLLLLFCIVLGCGAAWAELEEEQAQPLIATFSVVAFDPSTGEVGVAVQSKFFAVGSVVPWAKAGVGAVASQAMGNPTYGPIGLKAMEDGANPQDAISICLVDDEDRERRQIGMVSAISGEAGTYTGDECLDWAGGRTGVTPAGIVYAVQGNILTGPEVVEAMATALETGDLPEVDTLTPEVQRALLIDDFAGWLLKALIAGQQLGGDSRGMQSAALLVCQEDRGYGGYTDVKYDLRVDDATDPFEELARLMNLARPYALITEGYTFAYEGEFARAFAVFEDLIELDPEELTHHYHYACALALSGDADAALDHLRIALEYDPEMIPHAQQDPDLESLYELDEFKAMMGAEAGEEEKGKD